MTSLPPPANPEPRRVSRPHSKLNRLCEEAAARGGTLTTFNAVAKALGLTPSRVTQIFGHGQETTAAIRPETIVRLAAVFTQDGVTCEVDWFYLEFADFANRIAGGRERPAAAGSGQPGEWEPVRTSTTSNADGIAPTDQGTTLIGFISYAHADIRLLRELQTHLRSLERVFGVIFWADTSLDAGRHWRGELQHRIDAAKVFLLLASHNYFASDFINDHEYPAIETRLNTLGTLAIPVICLPCGWEGMFSHIHAVPTVGGHVRPIERWERPHDGYDRAREQIQDSLKSHFGLRPRIRGNVNPLESAGQNPAGLVWVRQGDQFTADRGGNPSDAVVSSDPQVRQLHDSVIRQAEHFARTAARLGNAPGWRGIDRDARSLVQAVNRPAAELLGELTSVYEAIAAVASYRDMDQRLRAGSPGTADPLDAETARELGRLVDSAAIWIRQFPTMRALDDALLGWRGVAPQRAEAADVVQQARSTHVVSDADAARVAALLEAGGHDGEAGEKAAVHGILGVRNLLYRGGGLLTAEALAASDADVGGGERAETPRQSLLGQRLRDLLDVAGPQIVRFIADLPVEVRQAFARLLSREPIEPADTDGNNAPTQANVSLPGPPSDFNLTRAHELLVCRQALPTEWVPFVTSLDLSADGIRPLHNGIRRLRRTLGLSARDTIDLRRGSNVINLQLIAHLNALKSLDLMSTPVSDVAPLAGLTALQRLNLQFTLVSDVAPLASLSALQSLDLRVTQVSDVAPLAGLTALQSLDLRNTKVRDVAPLAGLTALQYLDLAYTKVSDVTPLAGLTALQILHLRNTRVSDVAPLAGLTALQSLDLQGTQVSDVAPLAGLTALQSLDLRFTPVSDVAPLAGLTALQSLNLSFTQVSDVAALAHLRGLEITGAPRESTSRQRDAEAPYGYGIGMVASR